MIRIALFLIAWVICAIITCGAMIHVQQNEWNGAEGLCMFACFFGWPILALIGVVFFTMKELSKLGVFFAGFFDKMFEKKDNEETKEASKDCYDCLFCESGGGCEESGSELIDAELLKAHLWERAVYDESICRVLNIVSEVIDNVPRVERK